MDIHCLRLLILCPLLVGIGYLLPGEPRIAATTRPGGSALTPPGQSFVNAARRAVRAAPHGGYPDWADDWMRDWIDAQQQKQLTSDPGEFADAEACSLSSTMPSVCAVRVVSR